MTVVSPTGAWVPADERHGPDPLFASAYKAGYLEGAMERLLLRLEYDSRENMAKFVRESLTNAELPRREADHA